MFANTITLTIGGSARVLNRVNQDNFGSEYQLANATESIVMKIRHSVDKADGDGLIMKRHNVYVERTVYPTSTTLMRKFTTTVTLRHGKFDDPLDVDALYKALGVWLGTSTNSADLAGGSN